MRIAVIASLLLASATLSANAFADTITFASTVGVTTFSGPHDGTGTAVGYVYPVAGVYGQPVAGSAWVSTNSSGGYQGVETVLYTDTFTLLANELYSGSISWMADNNAGVVVNGVEVYPINSTSGYSSPITINLLSSYFHAGANTITLEAYNSGGQGAVDFGGTLNGVAITPEPSSLVLLGTGLLGMAGAARRRFRAV